jgi:4-hydroxy-tetrahydrodipicolinate synthase
LNVGSSAISQPSRWADGQAARREIWPVPPVPFTADNRIDERAIDELVEFYVAAGVDGLFILAYSGEAFELSGDEQLAICRRVFKRVAGRLRIVVAGNTGDGLDNQIAQLKRIAEFEPHATVIFLSTLPHADQLLDDLGSIASQIDSPLGVYECPAPEHRLLSPEEVATLAATGQFVFMKETSRDRHSHRAKLRAAQDSPLKLYQANWGELPRSLDDGCPGFCGVIANVFPELTNEFCNADSLSLLGRQALHEILANSLSSIARRHYPATMKYVLQKRGLSINTTSRMKGAHIDAEDVQRLDEMLDQLSLLRSATDILSLVSKRADDGSEATLRGPHRPAEWASSASIAANSSDID